MPKIPLERTVESTYRFAFTNLLSVFGVMWLPGLIFVGLVGAIMWMVWPDFQGLLTLNLSSGWPRHLEDFSRDDLMRILRVVADVVSFTGLIVLVAIVFRAMITVGVLEKALGKREGPVFVYFSFGAPVWRLIGALMVVFFLIIPCLLLATGIVAAAAIWAAAHYAAGILGLVKFVVGAASVLWLIYAFVRLAFFLPAVVVAEERIGIARAWELGGGNFWRIIGLMLAVLIPLSIVFGVLGRAVFGSAFIDLQLAVWHHTISPRDAIVAFVHMVRTLWPYAAVFFVLHATVRTALGLGAMASAYKAVAAPGTAA
jgi:hypothetical protein